MRAANRYSLPPILLALLAVLLLAGAPQARAADTTAGTEAELAAAIDAVNAAGPGNHTITLTASITLTAELPALDNAEATELLIEGAGFTLTSDDAHTALVVATGTTARLHELTITGGAGSGGLDGQSGGGVYNRGRLTVSNATISGNRATHGAGIYVYGGPGNAAELTLENVTLSDNTASREGGGVAAVADQGAVTVVINDSTLSGNSATNYGGGVAGSGLTGTVQTTIGGTTIAGNSSAYGGGLYVNGNAGESRLDVVNSAVTGNTAAIRGGGIYNNGNDGLARVTLLNSTVSGNSADGGGGIASTDNGGEAQLELTFVTVAANTAAAGSALFNSSGAAATFAGSIIATGGPGAACAKNGGSTFASQGYNLGDDASCNLTEATDIPTGNPALDPLALNAPGATATHALGAASDAQRRIPSGVLGCGETVATDQRGSARPVPGDLCDIGAYESDAEPGAACAPPYLPASEAELNAAIACVNAAGTGSHVITLAANITLTSATTPLDNVDATELLLDGNGHTVNGDGHGPILSVAAGTTARVRAATLTGGAADDGAGIHNRGALTVEDSRITGNTAVNGGGGIYSLGSLTVKNTALSGNTAEGGGGIAALAQTGNAPLTIADSTLSGNTAGIGGGIYVYSDGGHSAAVSFKNVAFEENQSTTGAGGAGLVAGPAGKVTATIIGSRFAANTGQRGGGLWAHAENGELSANVNNTTFSGNGASEGGATALTAEVGGTAQMLLAGSTLHGNSATLAGGGVHDFATTGGTVNLTLFNATLSSNNAAGFGGGLHVAASGGTAGATITYSTLAGNVAGAGGGGLHTAAAGGAATATLTATIITNGLGGSPDCARPSGNIVSTGYNLAGDATCFLNQGNDQPNTAAGLLPLALNPPGATQTYALAAGSAALDRIPIGAAGCGTAIMSDQRGAPRPQPSGGRCDVGAYELEQTVRTLFLPVIRR